MIFGCVASEGFYIENVERELLSTELKKACWWWLEAKEYYEEESHEGIFGILPSLFVIDQFI